MSCCVSNGDGDGGGEASVMQPMVGKFVNPPLRTGACRQCFYTALSRRQNTE